VGPWPNVGIKNFEKTKSQTKEKLNGLALRKNGKETFRGYLVHTWTGGGGGETKSLMQSTGEGLLVIVAKVERTANLEKGIKLKKKKNGGQADGAWNAG